MLLVVSLTGWPFIHLTAVCFYSSLFYTRTSAVNKLIDWWKNFENWSTFGEVKGKSRVSCFLLLTVYIACVLLHLNDRVVVNALHTCCMFLALQDENPFASLLFYWEPLNKMVSTRYSSPFYSLNILINSHPIRNARLPSFMYSIWQVELSHTKHATLCPAPIGRRH